MALAIPRVAKSLSAVTVLVFLATSHAAYAGPEFTTRAITDTDGNLGPGLGPGLNYTFIDPGVLNNSGHVLFSARDSGASIINPSSSALWISDELGGPSVAARGGDAAPGTGFGVTFADLTEFSFFKNPVINDSGEIAFLGEVAGAGVDDTNNFGIWAGGTGPTLSLVAREGGAAPGTPAGVTFNVLDEPVLNQAGQTAFAATLTGTGVSSANSAGVWSEGGGAGLELVARTGTAAPDTSAGVTFSELYKPVLNPAGETAFFGILSGPGINLSNDFGLWSNAGGANLSLVARTGDAAPGTTAGVQFSDFGINIAQALLNASGQTAFWATLSGPGVDGSNDFGIWSGNVGGVTLAIRGGDAAPGTAAGVTFSGFNFPTVLNNDGEIAFVGFLSGPGVNSRNGSGVWSEAGGLGLSLIARTGDDAPGTPSGVRFSFFSDPVINGAGQTAFQAILTGQGTDFTTGIWATDANGALQLIARQGDTFDVSNDPLVQDIRTISSVGMYSVSGGYDGRGTSFNDQGQLLFWLRFTDGTRGIFIADLSQTLIPADLSGDGDVDDQDLGLFFSAFTGPDNGPSINPAADLSGDGDVDDEDLGLAFSAFTGPLAPVNIPEPATLAVLCFTGLLAARRNRSMIPV